MTIPTPPPIPDRVVLGANGAYWRDFSDGFYSMCPNSTDNDPVEPVAVFVPERDLVEARDVDALVVALQKHKDRIQALQQILCTCDEQHTFQSALHDETCPVWLAAQEPLADGGDRG